MLVGRGIHRMVWDQNDNVYIVGGDINGNYIKECEKFNLTTMEFTRIASLPDVLRGSAIALVGDNIYCFGGYSSSIEVEKIYVYSISTDSWSVHQTKLPKAANSIYACYVASINGIIIFANGQQLSKTYVFDISSQTIVEHGPPYPEERYFYLCWQPILRDEKVWFFDNDYHLYYYDLQEKKWEKYYNA